MHDCLISIKIMPPIIINLRAAFEYLLKQTNIDLPV